MPMATVALELWLLEILPIVLFATTCLPVEVLDICIPSKEADVVAFVFPDALESFDILLPDMVLIPLELTIPLTWVAARLSVALLFRLVMVLPVMVTVFATLERIPVTCW